MLIELMIRALLTKLKLNSQTEWSNRVTESKLFKIMTEKIIPRFNRENNNVESDILVGFVNLISEVIENDT